MITKNEDVVFSVSCSLLNVCSLNTLAFIRVLTRYFLLVTDWLVV